MITDILTVRRIASRRVLRGALFLIALTTYDLGIVTYRVYIWAYLYHVAVAILISDRLYPRARRIAAFHVFSVRIRVGLIAPLPQCQRARLILQQDLGALRVLEARFIRDVPFHGQFVVRFIGNDVALHVKRTPHESSRFDHLTLRLFAHIAFVLDGFPVVLVEVQVSTRYHLVVIRVRVILFPYYSIRAQNQSVAVFLVRLVANLVRLLRAHSIAAQRFRAAVRIRAQFVFRVIAQPVVVEVHGARVRLEVTRVDYGNSRYNQIVRQSVDDVRGTRVRGGSVHEITEGMVARLTLALDPGLRQNVGSLPRHVAVASVLPHAPLLIVSVGPGGTQMAFAGTPLDVRDVHLQLRVLVLLILHNQF